MRVARPWRMTGSTVEFTERSETFWLEKQKLLLGLLDDGSLERGVLGEGVRGIARRTTLADDRKRSGVYGMQ